MPEEVVRQPITPHPGRLLRWSWAKSKKSLEKRRNGHGTPCVWRLPMRCVQRAKKLSSPARPSPRCQSNQLLSVLREAVVEVCDHATRHRKGGVVRPSHGRPRRRFGSKRPYESPLHPPAADQVTMRLERPISSLLSADRKIESVPTLHLLLVLDQPNRSPQCR